MHVWNLWDSVPPTRLTHFCPPLCSRTANVGTVGMNGLRTTGLERERRRPPGQLYSPDFFPAWVFVVLKMRLHWDLLVRELGL